MVVDPCHVESTEAGESSGVPGGVCHVVSGMEVDAVEDDDEEEEEVVEEDEDDDDDDDEEEEDEVLRGETSVSFIGRSGTVMADGGSPHNRTLR